MKFTSCMSPFLSFPFFLVTWYLHGVSAMDGFLSGFVAPQSPSESFVKERQCEI